MPQSALRGFKIVSLIIAAAMSISVVIVCLWFLKFGWNGLELRIVRLVCTAVLCRFLYVGVSAARWLTMWLFGLGGLFAIVVATTPSAYLVASLQLAMAATLALSSSVDDFCVFKNSQRSQQIR